MPPVVVTCPLCSACVLVPGGAGKRARCHSCGFGVTAPGRLRRLALAACAALALLAAAAAAWLYLA